MTGADRIAAERKRQLEVEGWTPDHDAEHSSGELVKAAVAYAIHGLKPDGDAGPALDGLRWWPKNWFRTWWKPASRDAESVTREGFIRQLEKAGALLAAEIDRRQREMDKQLDKLLEK